MSVCKRGKMGRMIESRKERSASMRTSIDCVDAVGASSGNVGDEVRCVFGVRESERMSLSVCSGWKTYTYPLNIRQDLVPEEIPDFTNAREQFLVFKLV
jgi:hypothetical protein